MSDNYNQNFNNNTNGYNNPNYNNMNVCKPPISPEDNKKANIFSLISLLLVIFAPIYIALVNSVLDTAFSILRGDTYISGDTTSTYIAIAWVPGLTMIIVALVLLIYTRVKYPQNVFSKVLIIVYIVLFIALVVLVVSIFIACGLALQSCLASCYDFPGILLSNLEVIKNGF